MKALIHPDQFQPSWLELSTVQPDHPNSNVLVEKPMFDLQSLVARLGSVSFFKNLPVSALRDIVFAGRVQHFPAESVIFREGEPAAGMHVLLKGNVRLSKVGLQGLESIVYLIKSVVMFNETTVIDGKPNPVTATSDTDCITWIIAYDRYQTLMGKYPVLGLGLLRILAERNRVLLSRYEDLMSRPVLARTAKILLVLSENGKRPINRTEHPNQRIAAMAATVPEAISRSIKILRESQTIQCTRGEIKIISVKELSEFALVEPIILEYPHRP